MTKAQARNAWFHGLHGEPATPDVGLAFDAGWDAREEAASRAHAVAKTVDTPEIVRWIESTTLKARVSLPAVDYDALRAENERLKAEAKHLAADRRIMHDEIERLRAEIKRLQNHLESKAW